MNPATTILASAACCAENTIAPLTATLAECAHCGEPFQPDRRTQRFCSSNCRWRYKDRRDWQRTKVDPEFAAKYRAKNRNTHRRRAERLDPNRRWRRAQEKLAKAAEGLQGSGCWIAGCCARCGEPFVTKRRNDVARYCSRNCGQRDKRERHHLAKRAGFVERVYRSKLFERDNWHCQLCDKPVPRDKRCPHPLAATIDHIIPVSVGGDHSYANTQLAHAICNSRKGAGPAHLRMLAA